MLCVSYGGDYIQIFPPVNVDGESSLTLHETIILRSISTRSVRENANQNGIELGER